VVGKDKVRASNNVIEERSRCITCGDVHKTKQSSSGQILVTIEKTDGYLFHLPGDKLRLPPPSVDFSLLQWQPDGREELMQSHPPAD